MKFCNNYILIHTISYPIF